MNLPEKKASSRGKAGSVICLLLIALVPLIPMYVIRYFYIDWMNTLWVTQYFSKWISELHRVPMVINTSNKLVGSTNPMYYGYLFYPLLGSIDVLVGGARRAMVLMMIIVFTAHTLLVYSLYGYCCGEKRGHRLILTALTVWNTYILNLLFEDGATGEFWGLMFLHIAIESWLLAYLEKRRFQRLALWVLSATGIMMAGGTHPVTAEIGGVVYVVMVLITLPGLLKNESEKKWIVIPGILLALTVGVALFPWFYTVLRTQGNTKIVCDFVMYPLGTGLIGMIQKFFPYPFDLRSLYNGTGVMSPYMDTQMNMPLAAFYLWLTWKCLSSKEPKIWEKVIAGIVPLVVLFFALLSGWSNLAGLAAKLFYSIQFAYRITAYADLAMLLGILWDLTILNRKESRAVFGRAAEILLIVCLTVSAHNVTIQWSHAASYANHSVDDISGVDAPHNFYWMFDYGDASRKVIEIPEGYEEISVSMPLENSTQWPGTVHLQLDRPTVIHTNILATEFSTVAVNGVNLEPDELFILRGDEPTWSFATQDKEIDISYVFVENPVYSVLRKISFGAEALLILVCICLGAAALVQNSRRKTAVQAGE